MISSDMMYSILTLSFNHLCTLLVSKALVCVLVLLIAACTAWPHLQGKFGKPHASGCKHDDVEVK
jgi:hypothetical protein